jgi:hypothetical protein
VLRAISAELESAEKVKEVRELDMKIQDLLMAVFEQSELAPLALGGAITIAIRCVPRQTNDLGERALC